MRDRGLEFKVGALVAASLVILAVFIVLLGNFSLGKGFTVYVDYNFSGNIHPGAPVKVSGIKIGRVDDVIFYGGKIDPKTGRRVQVRLKLWLQDRVKDTIRQDAEFFVNTQNVLGEQYVEIAPGSFDKPALAPGSTVVGVDPPRTDLIVARLYEFLDSITTLLHEDKDLIRDLLKNSAAAVKEVAVLLTDNREEIGRLIVSTGKLADEGAALLADVRGGLGDPRLVGKTVRDLDVAIVTADKALTQLMPRAVKLADEGIRVTGLVTSERIDRTFAVADGALRMLDKASRILDDAGAMMSDLRGGKGTAGKFLIREELYADIKEMVRDLKRNPWKFFWKE